MPATMVAWLTCSLPAALPVAISGWATRLRGWTALAMMLCMTPRVLSTSAAQRPSSDFFVEASTPATVSSSPPVATAEAKAASFSWFASSAFWTFMVAN